jgi:5-(carboxyamino)imidazole ribonucleotide mutase
MPQVSIIFGSASDAPVMEKIVAGLKEHGISFEARASSAHRTPEKVEHIIAESDASIFITGAGLSAALPGVVASQTIKPVIGVAVPGNYGGLDSLLATHQMPPGIPVLGTGLDAGKEAAAQAHAILNAGKKVVLIDHAITEESKKRMEACENTLIKLGITFETAKQVDDAAINIHFVPLGKEARHSNGVCINVPIATGTQATDAPELTTITHGLWVGLGRGENAALAAAEIVGLKDETIARALVDYRSAQKEKVLASDKEIQQQFGGD